MPREPVARLAQRIEDVRRPSRPRVIQRVVRANARGVASNEVRLGFSAGFQKGGQGRPERFGRAVAAGGRADGAALFAAGVLQAFQQKNAPSPHKNGPEAVDSQVTPPEFRDNGASLSTSSSTSATVLSLPAISRALPGHADAHRPHPAHSPETTSARGRRSRDFVWLLHGQRKGQPWKNTVVGGPQPSCPVMR